MKGKIDDFMTVSLILVQTMNLKLRLTTKMPYFFKNKKSRRSLTRWLSCIAFQFHSPDGSSHSLHPANSRSVLTQ